MSARKPSDQRKTRMGRRRLVDRLADKARRWRDAGIMSESEYGAVCAVLFVNVLPVTVADREWALSQIASIEAGRAAVPVRPTMPAAEVKAR